MGDDLSMKMYELHADLIEKKVAYTALEKEFDRSKEQTEKERKKEQAELMELNVELMTLKRENSKLREKLDEERKKFNDERVEKQRNRFEQLEKTTQQFMEEMKETKKSESDEMKELAKKLEALSKRISSLEVENSSTSGGESESQEITYAVSEIADRPWLMDPKGYEVKCVWNNCTKMIPLSLTGKDIVFCVHCTNVTPIAQAPEGKRWIFFNGCAHVACILKDKSPTNCLTCKKEKTFQVSNFRTPTKKE